jgi:hypothetical protein
MRALQSGEQDRRNTFAGVGLLIAFLVFFEF